MTLQQAIAHAKEVAASKCDECGKEHAQLAAWLTKLQGYEDTMPITEKWLQSNGFNENGFTKIGDNVIRCYETGYTRWFVSVDNDNRNFHEKFSRIKTLGQLRMFITLCDFDNKLVKQN